MLSSVSVLGACGDDDGGAADGDDGDDADDDGGDEPDAGECDHLVGCPPDGGGDIVQEATFATLADNTPLAGSEGTLTRNAEGFTAEVVVPGLMPDHVYTFWWVFYQNPEECVTQNQANGLRCGTMDLPVPATDPAHVVEVQSALVYGSGDTLGGQAVGADGTFTLTREYATNTDPTLGLFPGANPPPAGYWLGITDSLKAEVHLAIRDHGPEGNGGLTLEDQAGSFNSPNCVPPGTKPTEDQYVCATYAGIQFPPAPTE
jgi:hypothetical protein